MIEIEGGFAFVTDCELGDLLCGAKATCEAVTGGTCLAQNYDCQAGDLGHSFYPDGGEPGDSFNFGAYALAMNFGNICACDMEKFTEFNIPQLFDACGEGNWRYVP